MAAIASLCSWDKFTGILLAGLVILSYGFNNIAVPLPGVTVPLVDVLLMVLLVASRSQWKTITASPVGRRILLSLAVLTAIGLGRLIIDVPRYGVVAGRDALYILEAWGVLVGYAWGMRLGSKWLERRLGTIWMVALLWFLLLPFQASVIEAGPTVGVQRPTPLLAFTSAGFVSTVALFWFLQRSRGLGFFFSFLSLLVLLMAQGRGAYLAVLATAGLLIAGSLRSRDPSARLPRGLLGRVGVALGATLLVVAMLPPIPGRVGVPVGPDAVVQQLLTLTGADGPGAGSFQHRLEAWGELGSYIAEDAERVLLGVGFGPDLFQEFTITGGVLVRKPHNDVLEVWARTGLVGLTPWILLLGLLVAAALTSSRKVPGSWWIVALQLVMIVTALSQPFFAFAYGGLTYFLLTGAFLGAYRDQAMRSLAPSA